MLDRCPLCGEDEVSLPAHLPRCPEKSEVAP